MSHINDLDTPALLCDLNVLEANLELMAERCRALDIALRPHTKSHKVPEISKLQIEHGAQGITCQKFGEAEAMAAGGIDDILVAYNIVGRVKTERLAKLAASTRVLVAVDSETTARGISDAMSAARSEVGILIELDTGSHRCGVQSPEDAATLAAVVGELPGVRFDGIMTYPSQESAKAFIDETVELIGRAGLECSIISGGGTGSEAASKFLGCTETRSGSYIWEGGSRINKSADLSPDRCPLRLYCTVVSTAVPGQMIFDAGMKALTALPGSPYGYIIDHPDAKIKGMSVEHGHVDITDCSHEFKVGDRILVIPLHGGMATNLHNRMYAVRNGVVEAEWVVAGRGRFD